MPKTATMSTAPEPVEVKGVALGTVIVPIIGTSPLIMHRWSEKAKRLLLDRAQGRKAPKEPKDPHQEYMAALYELSDGRYGFPSVAFKSATVGAARFFGKDLTMTMLRQSIFVDGELGVDSQKLVEIFGDQRMREDVVRLPNNGTEMRYRPEFVEWSANLRVSFAKNMLTLDTLLSLIQGAGFGVGVGEWRPEKRGDFGTFTIDESKEVEIL